MKFFNLRCIQCSYVFCKNCHQGYHEDDDCEAASEEATANEIRDNNLVRDPQMALQARWQEQSSLAIKVMKTRFWNFFNHADHLKKNFRAWISMKFNRVIHF